MTPFKPRIFTPIDVISAAVVPVIFTGLMAWGQSTPGNEAVHLALGWTVVFVAWAVVVAHFVNKKKKLAIYKWVSKQGVLLGARDCDPDWTGVEDVIDEAIFALSQKYPDAARILVGVEAIFVPTAFYIDGRKVAGAQSDTAVMVALHPRMEDSALGHELGHVVLQYLDTDPPEAEAHRILDSLGL
jgi:hypothetical protein